jgi:hypothetical protein
MGAPELHAVLQTGTSLHLLARPGRAQGSHPLAHRQLGVIPEVGVSAPDEARLSRPFLEGRRGEIPLRYSTRGDVPHRAGVRARRGTHTGDPGAPRTRVAPRQDDAPRDTNGIRPIRELRFDPRTKLWLDRMLEDPHRCIGWSVWPASLKSLDGGCTLAANQIRLESDEADHVGVAGAPSSPRSDRRHWSPARTSRSWRQEGPMRGLRSWRGLLGPWR